MRHIHRNNEKKEENPSTSIDAPIGGVLGHGRRTGMNCFVVLDHIFDVDGEGRRRWSLQGGLLLASNNSQGYKETAPQDNKVSSPRPRAGRGGSLLGRNSLSTSRSLRSNSSGFSSIGW